MWEGEEKSPEGWGVDRATSGERQRDKTEGR